MFPKFSQKLNGYVSLYLDTVSAFGAYDELGDWIWELGIGEIFELNAASVGPPGDFDL